MPVETSRVSEEWTKFEDWAGMETCLLAPVEYCGRESDTTPAITIKSWRFDAIRKMRRDKVHYLPLTG